MSGQGKPGFNGYHDLGGIDEGPLVLKEYQYQLWEIRVHALSLELVRQKLLTVDELRRGIEALPPATGEALTYYEKWASSIAAICVERGVITQAELEAELGSQPQEETTARFKAGDVVRVLEEHVGGRWRKPHLRTPGYIFGLIGTIERESQGLFGNPEAIAFRHPAPKLPLYRVRFNMCDVWEGYMDERDVVDVEIYQSWLEPSSPEALAAQSQARAKRQAVFHAHSKAAGHHHHHHQDDHDDHHHHDDDEHEDHVHEGRAQVEQTAVTKEEERQDDERRLLAEALTRLLIKKGVVTGDALREGAERLESIGRSGNGARLVARAWVDPDFKQRLLKDAGAAATELGISASIYPTPAADAASAASSAPATSTEPADLSACTPLLPVKHTTILTAVENTPDTHNVIVCTLCSCYPLSVLGTSPSWYKSRAYRARTVRDPRGVLKEFGTELPDTTGIAVHDSTADNRYIVLPMRPAGTEGWTEEQLATLVTRDTMIGVAIPKLPPVKP